jgi:restriction system protein
MDGNAKKGVFITTAEFSSEAKQYANGRQDKRVILIDGPQLVEFMVEVGLGISVRQTYRTYRIDQDYLDQVDE